MIGALTVATAAIGASSSAVFLLPALAITLALSAVLASEQRAVILQRVPMFSLTLAYPAVFGAFILTQGAADLGASSPANYGWPSDFLGHASFLVNPSMPVTPVVFVITTGAGLLLLRGKPRRLLAAWVLCAAVLFLNPIVAPALITFVTSPNAYWRMFYILPFPLTIGIVASTLYSRAETRGGRRRDATAILAGALLAAAALSVPEASILLRPQAELGLTKFKLPEQLVKAAQDVIAVAPEGPMLAPSLLGGTVVLFDSNFPQVRIKKDPIRAWLYAQGSIEDAENRIRASDYLDGRPNGDLDALAWTIREHPGIRSIVLRRNVYRRDETRGLLEAYGYTSSQPIEGYVVVWR
jgi:hypothetical protein